MAPNAHNGVNHADVCVRLLQPRALLDMQFDPGQDVISTRLQH